MQHTRQRRWPPLPRNAFAGVEEMSAATAVRGPEAGNRAGVQLCEFRCEGTLLAAVFVQDDRTDHGCTGREIVNVPSLGFAFPAVTREAGMEVSLGAADVQVPAGVEVELAESAYGAAHGLAEVEYGYVDAGAGGMCRRGGGQSTISSRRSVNRM